MTDSTDKPTNVTSIGGSKGNVAQVNFTQKGIVVKHLKELIEAIESGQMPEPEYGAVICGYHDHSEPPLHMEFGMKEVHPYMIIGLLEECKLIALSRDVLPEG